MGLAAGSSTLEVSSSTGTTTVDIRRKKIVSPAEPWRDVLIRAACRVVWDAVFQGRNTDDTFFVSEALGAIYQRFGVTPTYEDGVLCTTDDGTEQNIVIQQDVNAFDDACDALSANTQYTVSSEDGTVYYKDKARQHPLEPWVVELAQELISKRRKAAREAADQAAKDVEGNLDKRKAAAMLKQITEQNGHPLLDLLLKSILNHGGVKADARHAIADCATELETLATAVKVTLGKVTPAPTHLVPPLSHLPHTFLSTTTALCTSCPPPWIRRRVPSNTAPCSREAWWSVPTACRRTSPPAPSRPPSTSPSVTTAMKQPHGMPAG